MREVQGFIEGWRALLTEEVADGRQLLWKILSGPLRFTLDGRSYKFEGDAAIGRLLAGMVGLPTKMASPRGYALVGAPKTFIEGAIAA
jgi:hypothetical protein